jgi:hypothetical protein
MRPSDSRIFVVGICVLLAVTLAAQVRERPTEKGPWRPWGFTAIASARQERAATAAEVQAYDKRLQELAAIIKAAPAVATPIGFAAELFGSLDSYRPAPGQPAGRAVPLAGHIGFGAFPLIEFMRNGRMVNEDLKGGETELLTFAVNEITGHMYGTPRPQGWGSVDLEAFIEPATGAPVAGLVRVGDVFVVKNNPKPLWVPFPIGEALQPILDGRRESFEQRRDNYAKQVAEFAEWQTPAKRAARRAQWQKAAASMPKGAEFVANMEKSDVEIEAAKKTQLAVGGPEEKGVREAERELKEVEGIVAALSPEQRKAPSCYSQGASRLSEQFRLKDGAPASCRPLVKPNWDYFDPKLPRSAPQVLMIDMFTRCLTPQSMKQTHRGGCVINRALVDSMDWNAVRAWLDR